MIKGFIFDMDGVIIDSNRVHFDNWSDLFWKRFNVRLIKEEFAGHMGENPEEFTNYFLKKYNLPVKYEEIYIDIKRNFEKFSSNLKLKPGLAKALEWLSHDYRIALATGAHRESAESTLDRFMIRKHFSYVIGGDEVKSAKPSPEIFLKAAEGLGLLPEDCVVIEDSYNGLRAAKAAGMLCIIVRDEFTGHHDHSSADVVLNSLNELNMHTIKRLEEKK